jgi:membrane protease YdiL (CAAX protease family)
MRDENQSGGDSQNEERGVSTPSVHVAELLGPIGLFVSIYLATFLVVGYGAAAIGLPFPQWAALIAVICATAFVVRIFEGGRWRLGIFVRPTIAAIDFVIGVLFATILVGFTDALVVASSHVRQAWSGGFPGFEVLTLFIPAALHEELAFRGYLFQKMRVWNRGAAIGITSLVFATLHAGNRGISALAIANLFLAGVLLALAYERYERLWFPIGIHLAWNLLSGPLLGFGVSGYMAPATLLRTVGTGPAWVTGGTFGVEGSAWMALAETGGIFWLSRGLKRSA